MHPIIATEPYLRLPIKNEAPLRRLTLLAGDKPEPSIEIRLADGEPDWCASMDIRALKGNVITFQIDPPLETRAALPAIEQTNEIAKHDNLYREALRPQFHFSSQQGWLNDPNGLVFFQEEYHLFYQHNPYGCTWGNMHWGHAVSRDLVHWKELGLVLYPDETGAMFSGSGVVDWKNTSGLGRDGQPPLVLLYTADGKTTTQCLAYSLDGRTFTKHAGNPVVKEIAKGNRDPKIIWHEPTHRWVMVLYVGVPATEKDEKGDAKHIETAYFLNSSDLKEWTVTSHLPFAYECPDLFELPVDDNAQNKKWVLTAANGDYHVGEFDGETFVPETPLLPGPVGKVFYAAQTFSDLPEQDGRRIQIGWLRADSPGMPFSQAMSLPLELKLATTNDGPRLTRTPVKELQSLRGQSQSIGPLLLAPSEVHTVPGAHGDLLEIHATFSPGEATAIHFDLRGLLVIYDAVAQEIVINGDRAKAPLREGSQDLTIYMDRTTIEIFGDGGLVYVAQAFIPQAGNTAVLLSATGGAAKIGSVEVYNLNSTWH